jgi:hypothetical protein
VQFHDLGFEVDPNELHIAGGAVGGYGRQPEESDGAPAD